MSANPLSEVLPWDLVALGYVDEVQPVFEKWAKDSFLRVSPKADDKVIDIACGPGTVSLLLAPLVRHIEALDFSPAMIAALNRRIAELGIANIVPKVCDCNRLACPDGTFDLAFSQFGLMFFPDRQTGFNEMFRVLKPGGRAAVYSWAPLAESESMSAVMGALEAAFPETRPKDDAPKTIVSGLDDPAVFEREMKASGFQSVSIERVKHSFPVMNPRQFWEGMVRGSAPVTLMKSRVDPVKWRAAEEVAVHWLENRLGDRTKLYSTAFLGSGMKSNGDR
jgi:SAM-dependent methyltransferase